MKTIKLVVMTILIFTIGSSAFANNLSGRWQRTQGPNCFDDNGTAPPKSTGGEQIMNIQSKRVILTSDFGSYVFKWGFSIRGLEFDDEIEIAKLDLPFARVVKAVPDPGTSSANYFYIVTDNGKLLTFSPSSNSCPSMYREASYIRIQ